MDNYKILEIDSQDELYPQRLKILKKPPKLYIMGNVKILNKDSIAIIGSRNSSEYGEKMAKIFSGELTRKGLVIVSGLALGIDTIAHYSCIETGGKTIAVIGSGFNHIYPEENKKLVKLILETGGTIISEYLPDQKVKKSNFPIRNRIISGLTLGTLVVESAHRSGTSITANRAIEQGKPVFCVPNSIGNKNSCGTIDLLLKGAILVKNAENIVSKLPELKNKIKVKKTEKAVLVDKQLENEKQVKIVKCIKKNNDISISEISKMCNISIQDVNCELTNLEINEIIIRRPGNRFNIVEE